MTNFEISKEVNERINRIKDLVNPETFVLNREVMRLKSEIKEFQKKCRHEFVDGRCKYCLKKEEGGTKN